MSDAAADSTAPDRRSPGTAAGTWRSRLTTVAATLLAATALGLAAACLIGLYLFRPVEYQDPDRARRITAEMLRVDVPPVFEPRGTIEWDLFRLLLMRGSYYELAGEDGLLMFLQVDSRLMDEPDVRRHVERTLRDKGGGGPPLTIIASEEVDYLLGTEHVAFLRRTGESPVDHSKKYVLIEGTVNGHSGPVLVAFRIAQEAWERTDQSIANLVEATIQSIVPTPRAAADGSLRPPR